MSKTLCNCSGPADWKTQVFMLDRGTCTGNDFCVSMTCDHQSWLWGRLCPWHLVGGEWTRHAIGSPKAHSPSSQKATPRLSSSTESKKKFKPVFRACVCTPLESDFASYLSRHQALSAFLGKRIQSTNSREGSWLTNLLRQSRNFQRLLSIIIYIYMIYMFTHIFHWVMDIPNSTFLGPFSVITYTYTHMYLSIYLYVYKILHNTCAMLYIYIYDTSYIHIYRTILNYVIWIKGFTKKNMWYLTYTHRIIHICNTSYICI